MSNHKPDMEITEMATATLNQIFNNEVSFHRNDFVSSEYGRIVAIHGYDNSTKQAYDANPGTIRVSVCKGGEQVKLMLPGETVFNMVEVK